MLHSGSKCDGSAKPVGSVEKPQPGDLVILYQGNQQLQAVYLEEGKIVQNKHGAFDHNEMLNTPYGTKVFSKNRSGWVIMMRPTPELWTSSLPHRTQILYTPDISLIILRLEIRPGHVVIESGTGSGSMSTALARCVGPRGHVYTFDFHDLRVQQANHEFLRHGMSTTVTCKQADVCEQGFKIPEGTFADAVFLDLPNPWLAVAHAKAVMRDGAGLCSFSPCIEQVQKTCEALREEGFREIATTEVLVRTWSIQHAHFDVPRWDANEDPQTRKKSAQAAKRKAPGDDAPADGDASARPKTHETINTVKPQGPEKGHTSFLTFAWREHRVWQQKGGATKAEGGKQGGGAGGKAAGDDKGSAEVKAEVKAEEKAEGGGGGSDAPK